MDADRLKEKVQLFVQIMLESNDPNFYARMIHKNVAPDAVFETPAHNAVGSENIHNVLALHAAVSENTMGELDWDEDDKTATISFKSRYSIPLDNAPWPISEAGRIKFNVQWADIVVHLKPDTNVPAPSTEREAKTYHVAKVATPHRSPGNRIVAAAYHAFLSIVRLVLPYVLHAAITVMKFFQRHPLRDGFFHVLFYAIYETTYWFWSTLFHTVLRPFGHRHKVVVCEYAEEVTDIDVPSSPQAEKSTTTTSTLRQRAAPNKLPNSAPASVAITTASATRSTPTAPGAPVSSAPLSPNVEPDSATAATNGGLAPPTPADSGDDSSTSRSSSPQPGAGHEHQQQHKEAHKKHHKKKKNNRHHAENHHHGH